MPLCGERLWGWHAGKLLSLLLSLSRRAVGSPELPEGRSLSWALRGSEVCAVPGAELHSGHSVHRHCFDSRAGFEGRFPGLPLLISHFHPYSVQLSRYLLAARSCCCPPVSRAGFCCIFPPRGSPVPAPHRRCPAVFVHQLAR